MSYTIADAFRPKSEKAAGFPLVVMEEHPETGGVEVGGFYVSPRRDELEVGGRFYDLAGGLIVARCDSTVAHEWRHHWQWFHGWTYDGIGWPPKPYRSYWDGIRRYFRESRSEMDALLYEVERVPVDSTLSWLEAIRSS